MGQKLIDWLIAKESEWDADKVDDEFLLDGRSDAFDNMLDGVLAVPKYREEQVKGWKRWFDDQSGPAAEFVGRMQKWAMEKKEPVIKEKIRATRERSELEAIKRDYLTPKLKGVWTNQENVIYWREKAYSKSSDEILEGPKKTLGSFAEFYNLTEDEAMDIITDKGLAIGADNKIMRD